ncbi:hypothetical protein [Ureibacillus endophyticus]|uniref:DUF3800 domain-containing protein n=1 Tax=Ureibacillus endophyticus TaxID=1978490 RepID=A0A494YX06_9BACL|nr:hypothetical protein [Lysinibacillus endophyticus]RKQ14682.1 hypothetical protein D8M03_13460 [Lysinibacillus endophyticus]
MNQDKNSSELIICFDESGKQSSDSIQLMGALSVPGTIYNHVIFEELHNLNKSYSLHWTEYNGYSKAKEGIEKLFDLAQPLAPFIQFNLIHYSKSALSKQANMFQEVYQSKKNIVNDTIYTKLPERICYGLLRGYSEKSNVRASILIEDSTEYRDKNLGEKMKNYLNIHSLYRGESFVIEECLYRKKGEEIGVELIDIILGIVGMILDNSPVNSNKKRAKVNLILQLLKDNKLQPFLNNLRVFELKDSNHLEEVNFEMSKKLFIANNFNHYTNL